ncbi:hypothetical protein Taro_050156 [Colocasia esculenta]|uniref:Uncharacterized protein n=1 Tax=Colocasia esculenta TaxID=4460 RepID=A0A843XD59_COLES|nr:hypothetical protein [Colocasia esculenta]
MGYLCLHWAFTQTCIHTCYFKTRKDLFTKYRVLYILTCGVFVFPRHAARTEHGGAQRTCTTDRAWREACLDFSAIY